MSLMEIIADNIKFILNTSKKIIIFFQKMDQNDLVRKNRARLSKRLYPNLPTWEISIWTSGWIFAVGYSMYHLFFASKREFC